MPAKGQVLSAAAIETMKRSKFLRWKEKLKWTNVDERFWDTRIDSSSRNRQLQFLTFRQFKDRVEAGEGVAEMMQTGVSKHLLFFFSVLAQGQIQVPQDQFISDYRSGLSLEELTAKYGISRESTTFLRQLYECKATGPTYQARKKTEEPLTDRQKDILYGTLMGDGKKMSPTSAALKHGPKQIGYVKWKYEELKNVASREPYEQIQRDKRTGKDISSWSFYTKANSDIEVVLDEFYRNGRKIVTRAILDRLTPLSVAVWFQDDGKTDFGYRTISTGGAHPTPQSTFCTESFSMSECQLICDWFRERYGIEACLQNRHNKGFGHRVRIKDFDKFVELVRPHMLPMFQYKVDYNAYVSWRKSDQSQVLLADLVGCARGQAFAQMGVLDQDALIRKFVAWLRTRGFGRLIGDLMSYQDGRKILDFDTAKISDENSIRFSHVGSKFIASFFPNFWEAKAKGSLSPKEMFDDDSFLFEIIRDLLSEGKFPKARHVLSKLRLYRHNKAVSLFMPCVAKAVYHRFAPDGARVLDFCGGYGGRLMGALACSKVSSYTGIDANKQSCEGMNRLFWHMHRKESVNKDVAITHGDSIESMKRFSDDAFDFCFTSPPYFNAEKYEEGEGQSSSQHQEYGSWLTGYLFVAVREACRVSKVVAINVANTGAYPIANDLRKWISTEMNLITEDKLISPRLGGGKREEPLFVLSWKGMPPPTM